MNFFIRYKKLFLVLGFIMTVVFLGYLLYAFFFKSASLTPTPATPTASSTGPAAGGLPTSQTGSGGQVVIDGGEGSLGGGSAQQAKPDPIASGGLTQTAELVQANSLDATLGGNGSDLQFYSRTDGKFYRVDNNGSLTPLSDQVFHNVEKVAWSPSKDKAILEYPDGANIIYDFSNKKQITLPSHWEDFSFSPSGSSIVMKSMGEDPSNRWLAIVNEDGSQVRGIEEMGGQAESVYPVWSPANQIVAMYTEGVDFDRQEVYFIGQNEENFKSTIVEGRGFQPKWSPTGENLLYSVYSSKDDLKPNLWIVGANGDQIGSNRKSLGLATWADKCTFASAKDLYCAVPNELPEGAGLFPELAKSTIDSLYHINASTGIKKKIAVPEGDHTITNPLVSADGRYLYFSDEATGRLHQIQLK